MYFPLEFWAVSTNFWKLTFGRVTWDQKGSGFEVRFLEIIIRF